VLSFSLAAASGIALFVCDYPVHFWPLQIVALVPFLFALQRVRSRFQAGLVGAVCGLFYLVPLSIALSFPWYFAIALAGYMTLIWVAFGALGYGVMRWPLPWAALGLGALMSVLEWVDFSLLPIWGTAQCFTRVWSAGPDLLGFVPHVGVGGLVFVVVSLQSFWVRLVSRDRRSAGLRFGLAGVAAIVLLVATLGLSNPAASGPTLRVAAAGWTYADHKRLNAWGAHARFKKLYLPLFKKAVAQRAELLVSPEVGFHVNATTKPWLFEKLASLARAHRIWLVVGYFDHPKNENRSVVFDATGKRRGHYVKSHLIYALENYRAGTGKLLSIATALGKAASTSPSTSSAKGVLLGTMICQDDNFTDLARGYGRLGTQLMAVPTNDWLQVKHYHLENSLFRAIENRYAIVRAATNGISAIVDPRGRVLARCDHFVRGPQVIVSDVTVYRRPHTLYSRFGDWFVLVCGVFLALGWLIGRRQRLTRKTAEES
jgi:apolipoprotein N-acyltransferase